jgi:hypothetical protein
MARPRPLRVAFAALVVAVLATPSTGLALAARPPVGQRSFAPPSYKGLNYGMPETLSGRWVGTAWLRSGTGSQDWWPQTRPVFEADLDVIQRRHLGRVIRIFVGLDQAMRWDPRRGFRGFDDQVLDNLDTALRMVEARALEAIVVVYDQEQLGAPGNFHVEALDGRHPAMRAAYLQATTEFFRRFAPESGVLGWDLFNEAYGSLGRDGHLPPPPAPDPASPGYDDETVHAWLRDLAAAARRGAPDAWLTVSDFGQLYESPIQARLYADVVDFYDIHVYDDAPALPDLRVLRAPVILGESGAGLEHYREQRFAGPAVAAALDQGRAAGAVAVLAHAGSHLVMTRDHRLTATGRVLAAA